MRKFLCCLFLFASLNAWAELYMKQNSQGDVTYTDIAIPGAKKITIDSPQTTSEIPTSKKKSAPDISVTNDDSTNSNDDKTETKPYNDIAPYTDFSISSPKDQETITNQQTIPISVTVSPDLQKGDTIQILLDNTPVSDFNHSTQFNISNVSRGTHSLHGALYDRNHNLVRQTQTVTVFVHYAHVGGQS